MKKKQNIHTNEKAIEHFGTAVQVIWTYSRIY